MQNFKINSCLFDKIRKTATVTANFVRGENWTLVYSNYNFDWVQIAESNTSKISGLQKNTAGPEPPTAEKREQSGTYLKPGKLIKAICADADICKVAADLQRLISGDDYSEIKVGDNITDIYNMNHGNSGTLGHSCMRGENYFQLYEDAGCKMAYIGDDGKLQARALLWDCLIDGEPGKMMDRVYTSNENIENKFFEWAIANGYHRKKEQNYNNITGFIAPSGANIKAKIEVDLELDRYDTVPFCDTLRYYDSNLEKLHNGHHDHSTSLDNTDGTDSGGVLTDGPGSICEFCGDRYDDEYEGSYIDGYGQICQYCSENEAFWCEVCEETFLNDDRHGNTNIICCEDCGNKKYTECESCGEWTENDDVFEGPDSCVYCDDCFNDKFAYCEDCESDYERDDMIEGPDGEHRCEDCHQNKYTKCEQCKEDFENDDLHSEVVNGADIDICEDCLAKFKECDYCGEFYSDTCPQNCESEAA